MTIQEFTARGAAIVVETNGKLNALLKEAANANLDMDRCCRLLGEMGVPEKRD